MALYGMRAGKDAVMFRIAKAMHRSGLTPNMITAVGLTLGVFSGAMFALHLFSAAFGFGFLSVFCDVLDGTLARKFHMESKNGLIFDSVSDRVTECVVVIGALAGSIIQPLGLLAIAGSVTLFLFRWISYRRGIKSDHVLFGRFERLVLILSGLVLPNVFASTLCFAIAGLFGLVSSLQIAAVLLRKEN
jgi:phosphatidylglycerophosphate synthase